MGLRFYTFVGLRSKARNVCTTLRIDWRAGKLASKVSNISSLSFSLSLSCRRSLIFNCRSKLSGDCAVFLSLSAVLSEPNPILGFFNFFFFNFIWSIEVQELGFLMKPGDYQNGR